MTSTGHPPGPPTVLRSLATEISPLRHTAPTSVPYRSLPVVLLLPGDRPRPLNGILGDDCSRCSPATDMLNNKNLSDLCRPELDTDGTRRETARTEVFSSNEIEK